MSSVPSTAQPRTHVNNSNPVEAHHPRPPQQAPERGRRPSDPKRDQVVSQQGPEVHKRGGQYINSGPGVDNPAVVTFVNNGDVSTFRMYNMNRDEFVSLMEGFCKFHKLEYEQML